MDHDTTRLAFPRPAKTANYSDGLLDGGDLVRRIYSARGHALEAVLEEAFNKANAPLVKLDTGGAPGRPDYLIQLENFPSIVAEVKSREADDKYIIFNATTEVLAASELLGRGRDFCLTICSPAVDPSVSGNIEGSGRLCVVDISDLCDALVRVWLGELSLEDLHNWLTRPGIALMSDLAA